MRRAREIARAAGARTGSRKAVIGSHGSVSEDVGGMLAAGKTEGATKESTERRSLRDGAEPRPPESRKASYVKIVPIVRHGDGDGDGDRPMVRPPATV
jgi:hypothetical protein